MTHAKLGSKTIKIIAVLAVSPFAFAGCVSEGTAQGEVEGPMGVDQGNATFSWKSDFANPTTGMIMGTLPDGTAFSGRYFEVVKTATAASYGPAWEGWPSPYWNDWDGFGGADYDQFVTMYSGKVIANLKSSDGKRLRCHFTLARPSAGLVGGGSGTCQGSDGKTISDVVLQGKTD